jgi:hypothetical protein
MEDIQHTEKRQNRQDTFLKKNCTFQSHDDETRDDLLFFD